MNMKLDPGEEIVETPPETGIFKSIYSPILTNKRALFKFNSLNSRLVQSFSYADIGDIQVVSRLLIKYLKLSARGRDYFFNIDNPEQVATKLVKYKEQFQTEAPKPPPTKLSLTELLTMLETLAAYGLLTKEELDAKRKMIM